MKRTFLIFLLSLLMATAAGCSVVAVSPGKAALPEGIENAQVPDVELGGYLYYSSSPPLTLNTEHFLPDISGGVVSASEDQIVQFDRASVVVGPSLDDFGGTIDFSSDEDAVLAWSLFQEKTELEDVWGMLDSPTMLFASGGTEWAHTVQSSLESGQLVSIQERDPLAWNVITNLPENPPLSPVAAGVIKLDRGILETLGRRAGIALNGIGNAFGFVRVDTLGFGVYSSRPIDVSVRIDEEYLNNSGVSVLFVSQSTYPSGLVAFMLSVIASRTEMELIQLGDTNARYRTIEDLHLIIKNKASLVYAAVAGNRQDAERLILSALAD